MIPKQKLTELRDLPLERPANAGSLWEGVSHYKMASMVSDQLKSWVGGFSFVLNPSKTQFSCIVTSTNPSKVNHVGRCLRDVIGLRTGNDGRCALKFYTGFRDEETRELFIVREINGGRKRSDQFDLELNVCNGLRECFRGYKEDTTYIERSANTPIKNGGIVTHVWRAAANKIIQPRKLTLALSQCYNHTGKAETISQLDVLGYLSRVIAKSPNTRQLVQLYKARQLFNHE
jgi:hypothetical protein